MEYKKANSAANKLSCSWLLDFIFQCRIIYFSRYKYFKIVELEKGQLLFQKVRD